MIYVDESALHSSDPETPIAVTEQFIRIDFAVPEKSVLSACASNGIGFDFVTTEMHESCGVSRN